MLFVIALSLAASYGSYSALGEGNSNCGQWIDSRRATPNRVIPESAWILGYITAASQFEAQAHPEINLTAGLTGNAVDHWTDNYCAVHPLDSITEASYALLKELRARRR